MKTGLVVNTIEHGAPLQTWFTHPYAYHLIFIEEGTLQYTCGSTDVMLQKNMVGIIKEKDTVSNIHESQAIGYVVSFSYEFLELSVVLAAVPVRDFHMMSPDLHYLLVSEEENKLLCSLAAKLRQELKDSNYDEDDMLRSLFQVLLLRLGQRVADRYPKHAISNNHIGNFYALIDRNFSQLKLPKDYAKLMMLTPNHLNTIVKHKTGYSSSYIIHQRLLAEAKKMLITEEMSMKEIAFRLGFADNSHFSRFFKNQLGYTFSDFRKNFKALELY